MSFKKISNKEYEIILDGRTKTVMVPFGKTEKLFKEFITNGGVINPETGEVQTDIMSLIASFKSVGNIILTEYDDTGKVVKEGNCEDLDTLDVISLFQLATECITNFMQGLAAMKASQETLNLPKENVENPQETTKA